MKTRSTCRDCGNTIPALPVKDALCVACRYHTAPPKQSAFEDNPAYRFAAETYAAPDAAEDEPAATPTDFAEKLARFLEWLAAGGKVKSAGQRALLLAHIAGKGAFATDAALARELNISRGRISQLRTETQDILPNFANCNRRQTKPRHTDR